LPYSILFPFLFFFSWIYAISIRFRNFLYDRSVLASQSFEIPIISVGNLTVGGTGKTPLVHLLAEESMRRGIKTGVVARGYKGRISEGGLINDEGMMLGQEIPGLIVIQDPDRVKAARIAIEGNGVGFLIMDDGFQHRRLARDLDLVVVDATRPFGFGRVLPAGLLREPLVGLKRAHVIVLTRCDQVGRQTLIDIESALRPLAPQALIFKSRHVPLSISKVDGSAKAEPSSLSGCGVFLFSGIANPPAFERTVSSLGADVKGALAFPDHHDYQASDLEVIRQKAEAAGAERVVTTAKDRVKVADLKGSETFWVLRVGLEFLEKADAFWERVFA
jgi:tetraacyldisaccharide 4'-kinase